LHLWLQRTKKNTQMMARRCSCRATDGGGEAATDARQGKTTESDEQRRDTKCKHGPGGRGSCTDDERVRTGEDEQQTENLAADWFSGTRRSCDGDDVLRRREAINASSPARKTERPGLGLGSGLGGREAHRGKPGGVEGVPEDTQETDGPGELGRTRRRSLMTRTCWEPDGRRGRRSFGEAPGPGRRAGRGRG
jgi:hypothetical protein